MLHNSNWEIAQLAGFHSKTASWEKVNRLNIAEVVTSTKANKNQKLSELANVDPVIVYQSALKNPLSSQEELPQI